MGHDWSLVHRRLSLSPSIVLCSRMMNDTTHDMGYLRRWRNPQHFGEIFLTFLSTLHVAWPRLRSWSQSSFANCARRISSLTEKRCDRTGWQDKEDGTEKKIKPTNLSYFSGRHFFPDCQIFRHQDGATPLPTIILHDHHRRPSVRPSVVSPSH